MSTEHEQNFIPIMNLVRKELNLRGHSAEYIHKYLNEHELIFRFVPTKITEKLIIKLSNQDVALIIDLKDISRAPYWIVQQLLEWGFELELNQPQYLVITHSSGNRFTTFNLVNSMLKGVESGRISVVRLSDGKGLVTGEYASYKWVELCKYI